MLYVWIKLVSGRRLRDIIKNFLEKVFLYWIRIKNKDKNMQVCIESTVEIYWR